MVKTRLIIGAARNGIGVGSRAIAFLANAHRLSPSPDARLSVVILIARKLWQARAILFASAVYDRPKVLLATLPDVQDFALILLAFQVPLGRPCRTFGHRKRFCLGMFMMLINSRCAAVVHCDLTP
jgi:hypothetical protein